MKKLVLFISTLIYLNVNAQITNDTNTVGLLYSEPEKVSDGYLLFAPFGSQQVYLIDNCGLVANNWTFANPTVYSGCYLLEDGSVLKLNANYDYDDYYNSEACIERRSWENDLMWQYCLIAEEGYFHSDVHILPNGNVLAIYLESISAQEAILNGFKPDYIGARFELETIIELKPIGIDSAEVVWEWRLFDHLIQDYDESKSNYGNVADNPRRYNINLYDGYNHFNSIDYNETLDQIVFSSWNDHEIYIIDHSTTTEEAASSTGGKYGFGGDYLFRWGNPNNYEVEAKQRLLGQHNPRWIPTEYQQFGGMISIFNNRYQQLLSGNDNKSAVVVINPDPDGDGIYEMESNQFLPKTYAFVLANENVRGGDMYSEIMSGAVVQPNGNIITCEAIKGRFMEFDTAGNLLWQYQCPVDYGSIINQGDRSDGGSYKVEKYTANYAGLLGRDLCGTAIIENENEVSEACKEFWLPKMAFLKNIKEATVELSLAAQNYEKLSWDFGDGNTSTEISPTHIYQGPGEYEICITGTNCYGENTYCEKIMIDITSIDLYEKGNSILLKNLVSDQLNLSNHKINIAGIYNAAGKLVSPPNTISAPNIDITNLTNGIYFLIFNFHNQNNYHQVKFCKM